jgi:hypothetical protein
MVHPLRPFLLNRQIATEARRIAHAAIKTCRPRPTDEVPEPALNSADNEHTKNCNALTHAITELALQVKVAGLQPPSRPQVGVTEDEKPEPEQSESVVSTD